MHAILRKIVAKTLESEDCKGLVQFTHLQRDIARNASEALDAMRLEARRMVTTMVEMERSYLTAEVCLDSCSMLCNCKASQADQQSGRHLTAS